MTPQAQGHNACAVQGWTVLVDCAGTRHSLYLLLCLAWFSGVRNLGTTFSRFPWQQDFGFSLGSPNEIDMHKIAKVTKRHQQVDLYMSTDMIFFFYEPPGVFLLITLRDAAGSCNHWWQCPEIPFMNSWNKFLSLWKLAVTLRASNGFPWPLFLQSFQQSYKAPTFLCYYPYWLKYWE